MQRPEIPDRNTSAAARAAAFDSFVPCSQSPRIGNSVSMNDEVDASGFWSQFQPPSGHCHFSSSSASRSHRSSASPSFVKYQSAYPCCEACARYRPFSRRSK
jgi:hypothetical protein